jgi:hypothetical protein
LLNAFVPGWRADSDAYEQAVSGALRTTRIIPAHRPQTIRAADRVIDLDQIRGRVVTGAPQRPMEVVSSARTPRDRPEQSHLPPPWTPE